MKSLSKLYVAILMAVNTYGYLCIINIKGSIMESDDVSCSVASDVDINTSNVVKVFDIGLIYIWSYSQIVVIWLD